MACRQGMHTICIKQLLGCLHYPACCRCWRCPCAAAAVGCCCKAKGEGRGGPGRQRQVNLPFQLYITIVVPVECGPEAYSGRALDTKWAQLLCTPLQHVLVSKHGSLCR